MKEKFLNYLQYERNYSLRTVREYDDVLRSFETYFTNIDSQLSWASVDADVIRGWMESMMDRGVMASTINTCLSAVRSFYRFALSRHLVEKDPAHTVKGPKKKKPLPQFMREGEMDRLIDGEQYWGTDFKDVRARTIIILFYETGIRVAELMGLDCSDVDMAQHQLKVTGKRNKQRIVPFGDELAEVLAHYMAAREQAGIACEPALFISDKGRRMVYRQVYQLVRKHLSMVTSMKKRSPHVLRHSFATAMLNHGAGLEGVRKLLGHESVATTEVYTHTTFEQLKRVYENAHPRA